MRKTFLFAVVFLSLINVSVAKNTITLNLTEYDFQLAEKSNDPTPPIRYWQGNELVPSYNEWKCFSAEHMTLTCTEHEMQEMIKTPMIAVYDGDETLEIETSPIDGVDCEDTLRIWQGLLQDEEEFCVIAAYLQDLPHENYGGTEYRSLWIIDTLKTKKGYWGKP